MASNEITEAAVAELVSRGIPATFGYPGFVNIQVGDEHFLACGTVNGQWDVDYCDLSAEVLDTTESDLPGDCEDINRIANHLACCYSQALSILGIEASNAR